MPSLPTLLIITSSVISTFLHTVHLYYTYYTTALHPTDASVIARLKQVPFVVTRAEKQTSAWNAYLGFHTTHSIYGATIGVIYIYLAYYHPQFLFSHDTRFLLYLRLAQLGITTVVAKKFFFSKPFYGTLVSFVMTAAAIALCGTGGKKESAQ